jgi:hypothetical protein
MNLHRPSPWKAWIESVALKDDVVGDLVMIRLDDEFCAHMSRIHKHSLLTWSQNIAFWSELLVFTWNAGI